MKAIVFEEPHVTRLADRADPTPAPGQALVRTRLTGICGSDMHAYLGSQPFFQYPEIPGHEVVGDVVDPHGASHLREGQRVALDPTINCGHCRPCRLGRYNCCANIKVIGVHAPGTMAELFVAPHERLHPVPEGLPDELAVLAEPLSIALHAVDRAELVEGDPVAIVGSGMIGLSVLLMARARGVRCMVADIEPSRLALAQEMGAEVTVNAAERDSVEAALEWTGGEGTAVSFEAVGSPPTIRQAADMVASAGRVVILGLCTKDVPLPGAMFVRKELEVIGSRLHQHTIEKVVAMLDEQRIDPRPMLTDIRPLNDYASALDDLQNHASEFIKIALRP